MPTLPSRRRHPAHANLPRHSSKKLLAHIHPISSRMAGIDRYRSNHHRLPLQRYHLLDTESIRRGAPPPSLSTTLHNSVPKPIRHWLVWNPIRPPTPIPDLFTITTLLGNTIQTHRLSLGTPPYFKIVATHSRLVDATQPYVA